MSKCLHLAIVMIIGLLSVQCKSDKETVNWTEVGDSLTGDVWIGGGDHYAVLIKASGELEMGEEKDPLENLTETSLSAIELCPEWIRDELSRTLARLTEENQNTLATEISAASTAPESILDEVAWAISVTDAPLLEWMILKDQESVFVLNAQEIYAVEEHLNYARLVELDDRTTLEVDGEDGTYEIDSELYYWHVVYPRAYFERPSLVEGDFWRTLFQTDTTYGATLLEAVADATTILEAAEATGEWIQGFMTFEYGTNQRHPIEVYSLPTGSCGQYTIITTSAARTVLIPTVSVSARGNDHEWNEFWDERWIMWDNSLGDISGNPQHPYIDWPHIYDDDMAGGPGRGAFDELAHVFRFFGNERIEPSDMYTTYEEVKIAVTDANQDPVEGAFVTVLNRSSNRTATWGTTDHRGEVSFVLGDDNLYGFNVTHEFLGDITAQGVQTTQNGGPYSKTAEYTTTLPRKIDDGDEMDDQDRLVTVDFTIAHTDMRQLNNITIPYEMGITHPKEMDGGVLDVFLIRANDYEAFVGGETVTAYGVLYVEAEGTLEAQVPIDEDWYLIFDNSWWPTSERQVSFEVQLSVRDE